MYTLIQCVRVWSLYYCVSANVTRDSFLFPFSLLLVNLNREKVSSSIPLHCFVLSTATRMQRSGGPAMIDGTSLYTFVYLTLNILTLHVVFQSQSTRRKEKQRKWSTTIPQALKVPAGAESLHVHLLYLDGMMFIRLHCSWQGNPPDPNTSVKK